MTGDKGVESKPKGEILKRKNDSLESLGSFNIRRGSDLAP